MIIQPSPRDGVSRQREFLSIFPRITFRVRSARGVSAKPVSGIALATGVTVTAQHRRLASCRSPSLSKSVRAFGKNESRARRFEAFHHSFFRRLGKGGTRR